MSLGEALNKQLESEGVSPITSIQLNQALKWIEQAGLFDANLTQQEVEESLQKEGGEMDLETFENFLETLCRQHDLPVNEVKRAMGDVMHTEAEMITRTAARVVPPEMFNMAFKEFAKFGDEKATGKLITLDKINMWLEQAQILGAGRPVNDDETARIFSTYRSEAIDIKTFELFLRRLCMENQLGFNETKTKLAIAYLPQEEQDPFKAVFTKVAKLKAGYTDGTKVSLVQSDKWMELAGLFGVHLKKAETTIFFRKYRVKSMNFETYQNFLRELCDKKQMRFEDVRTKLAAVTV